jgi:serine/threonine-protein kinase HipA
VHIIAKLPTVDYPLLPEVEDLTMQLAKAAGVDVCSVRLADLSQIDTEQPFILGEGRKFLAVERFDRTPQEHIHCEDFAQILGVPPEEKYTHASATYGTMATALATTPGLGIAAVEELLRRIVVNDLAGNFDGHLKNYGVLYRDGRTPQFSPAYDIVAYSAYLSGRGHALRFTPDSDKHERVTPKVIRALANMVPNLTEPQANSIVRKTVKLAYEAWPDLIAASAMLPRQKEQLLAHFDGSPAIASLAKRAAKAAPE